MNNILNFGRNNIEISIEELKKKIKEYYLSLDESIKEVNVKFSSEIKQGEASFRSFSLNFF